MSKFNLLDNGMSNEEWARSFARLRDEVSASRNVKYEINQPQLDKFSKVYNFFANVSEELGGKIRPMKLKASDVHGGVTATFPVFDIVGDDIQKFCEAIGCTSALSIDATLDGEVCISVTVPDVFVEV